MKIKQTAVIVLFTLTALFSTTSRIYAQDTPKEKAVKAYYKGFETKDWNLIEGQLADGFTFTSPAPDNDHISVTRFKNECFPTSKYFKSVKFVKMFESGDQLALLVEMTTTDNKIVRNVDIYQFDSAGKIKDIQCFFGPGIGYPGNKN